MLNEMRARKKLFIIGGLGYVGSKLAQDAVSREYDVALYDSLIYEQDHARIINDIAGAAGHSRATFIMGDVRNKALLEKSIRRFRPNFVFHFGELVGPACDHNPKFTEFAEDINYNGSKNVVDICADLAIPLVYNSSSSVYGNQQGVKSIREDHALPEKPASNYCKFKLLMEEYIKVKLQEIPRFRAIIFRPGTVGGVAPRIRLDLLPNHFTYCAVARGAIKISKPAPYRSAIDVKDLASAYLKVIEAGVWKRPVYNISNYNLAIIDYAKRIQTLEPCEIVSVQEGVDPRNLQIDCSTFENEFAYKPAMTYEDTVNAVAGWVKENKRIIEESDYAGVLNMPLDRWLKMI
ncbi:MAG TPA: NAD-dependent epimerase/dehydratase [Blastocatellia bacterium]|nr:NAD-dependent epimerase/dehydratase [Blastocatellia bacterium]